MSWQAEQPRLVLASASASRQALLAAAGLRFIAIPAGIDEAPLKQRARADRLSAAEAALVLADAKASAVARREPDSLVLGCDQLLVCKDRWFDKPTDLEQAAAQLRALRGRTHSLVTAALCYRGQRLLWHCIAVPVLTMRPFSDAFLDHYLRQERQQVTATVGAYRLEGPGVQLFAAIDGEHAAILGLPLLDLLDFLRRYGLLLD